MIIDSTITFVPIGSPLSLVAGAGVSIASPITVDLLGTGAGTAPQNVIGNVTLFGADAAIGTYKPQIQMNVGTACTTSTSCTLNVAFQGAPDLGTPTYQPGTWQTFNETGAMTAAQLTAGQEIRLDFFPVFPITARPRFLRLLFQVPAGADFTAGTISFAIVTLGRDDYSAKQAANNYVVA